MSNGQKASIEIVLGGRLLALMGVCGLLALYLLWSRGAAGQTPVDVNSITAEAEPAEPVTTPVSFPEPPEGYVWTVNGELIPVEALGTAAAEAESGASAAAAAGGRGSYYLTNTSVASNLALTACASGYHMASMWEIIDPSNMSYAYNHPAAHTKADSGQGPPSLWYGRVRTGTDSSTSATAGTGNCSNWTSVSGTANGVFVRLSRTWETPPGEIGGIWDATPFSCNSVGPVWCVGD